MQGRDDIRARSIPGGFDFLADFGHQVDRTGRPDISLDQEHLEVIKHVFVKKAHVGCNPVDALGDKITCFLQAFAKCIKNPHFR